jgi:predicted nucleic acid-binding protein
MKPAVLIDAGPLGVLTNPNHTPARQAAGQWLASLLAAGRRVILPDTSDYELGRELLLRRSVKALGRLAWLRTQVEPLAISSAAMRRAAGLWADARRRGISTAPPGALDFDVVLAAQADTLGCPTVVATMNVAHLSRFTAAEFWLDITP